MTQTQRTHEFFHLFITHQDRLYAYILTLVGHGADAEDLLQETATTAWEKFSDYQLGSDFGAWVRQIARYKILDHRKRVRRQRVVFSHDLFEALLDHAETVYQQTDIRLAALRHCLGQLNPTDRQLLQQRYEHGLTIKHIAEQSARSVQGLYKVMARIHNRLRRCVRFRMLQVDPLGEAGA